MSAPSPKDDSDKDFWVAITIFGAVLATGLYALVCEHDWIFGSLFTLLGLVGLLPMSPFVKSLVGTLRVPHVPRQALWVVAVLTWLFLAAHVGLSLHHRYVLSGNPGSFQVSGQSMTSSVGNNPEIADLQSQLRGKDAEIKDLHSQLAQFLPPMPRPNLSKEAITELLDETGKLLDTIQKTGLPLADEWRTKITAVNPELICQDLDGRALQQQIGGLVQKAAQANDAIGAILETNRIDQVELTKAMGENIGGFASAHAGLENYRENIGSLVRDRPTCEALVRTYNVPEAFTLMDRSLEEFSRWLAKTEDSLTNYRDNLRLELRSAP